MSRGRFEDWVRAHVAPSELLRVHPDAYLACALGDRDPAALAAFDRVFGAGLVAAARATGVDGATAADVAQEVVIELLVGDGARAPGIGRYGGRGELRAWLRTIATRTAWRHLARARRDAPDGTPAAPPTAEPALEHLRARYAAEMTAAIGAAFAALGARERTLLRLAYVDGLSVDAIGRIYAVHRATAARWVAAARAGLVDGARARLSAELDAGLTSVVRLVQSQLDVNLGALAGAVAQAEPAPGAPRPVAPP